MISIFLDAELIPMSLELPTNSGNSDRDLSPSDVRQCLLNMEKAMRMMGKAIHRFSEMQLVRRELQYDPMWTDFEVQMKQALRNVKDAVEKA
jgi:hypothetical protein